MENERVTVQAVDKWEGQGKVCMCARVQHDHLKELSSSRGQGSCIGKVRRPDVCLKKFQHVCSKGEKYAWEVGSATTATAPRLG